MTSALVLRPEPGNSATCARLAALGIDAVAMPLFAVGPVAWVPPAADEYDALLLTSGNAVRHAGRGLALLAALPVIAVGDSTAATARDAGLRVEAVGAGDAQEAVSHAGGRRLLHLAGRHRRRVPGATTVTVYESAAIQVAPAVLAQWGGGVALLHSARAARRFSELVPAGLRAGIALAALSPAVAEAAGTGWQTVAAAARPTDPLLVALAAGMIDRSARRADKPAS